MLRRILIAIILIIAVFVIVVAKRLANFRVTRSTTIAASAEVVLAQVNDFQKKMHEFCPDIVSQGGRRCTPGLGAKKDTGILLLVRLV